MRCCDHPPVIGALCKEHFLSSFEDRVQKTIEEFSLIGKGQRVAVAVSGGKDSLVLLTLLHRFGYDVIAIAIDEGIAGYRERTLVDARRVCDAYHIPLRVFSFEELAGDTLDGLRKKHGFTACAVCGVFRRHLLHRASKGFDVLATGHNADDESQAVLMNLVKGNTELFSRLGPRSGTGLPGFTPRVKPLYFCTEKEVATYAFLSGILGEFIECPYAHESYRGTIRDALNGVAGPEERRTLLRRFLVAKAGMQDTEASRHNSARMIRACVSCGEPTSKERCAACSYLVAFAR
jgi:uncharacterized protein (TIGR00269 family)